MFFLNIGGTTRVNAKEILSYSALSSAPIKRKITEAKNKNKLVDITGNKATKTVIFTKPGVIYLSPLRPETIDKRMFESSNETAEEEE